MSEEPAPPPPRRRRRLASIMRRGLPANVDSLANSIAARSSVSRARRLLKVAAYALRVGNQVLRQWARDRCPQLAASLAFQTVLSIVPLMAVGLALLRASGMVEAESSFVRFLTERFIPVSREELAGDLQRLSEHVTFKSLGLIGLATTVVLAFVMFLSLGRAMNVIWRVERRRSIAQTFVVFYASVTIGPLLLGVSLYQAAKFGLTEGGYGFLFSLLTSYVGLFLTIYFLPATKVRIRPALLGAAVTAITFEIAKYAFSVYVANLAMAKYSGIYGALAAVPLSLIWIYWSWMMLLLGAEVAHATQHLGLLEMSDRRGTLSLENELLQRVNGPMAVRLMVRIAETYIAGGKAVTRRQLGERFDLGDEVVDRLVRRLLDRDLLLEVDGEPTGLAPGRPPDAIPVAEVLAAFRVGDGGDEGGEARSAVDRLLAEIEGVQAERTGATTLADLARPV